MNKHLQLSASKQQGFLMTCMLKFIRVITVTRLYKSDYM